MRMMMKHDHPPKSCGDKLAIEARRPVLGVVVASGFVGVGGVATSSTVPVGASAPASAVLSVSLVPPPEDGDAGLANATDKATFCALLVSNETGRNGDAHISRKIGGHNEIVISSTGC